MPICFCGFLKGDHHFAGLGARFCFFGSVLKGTQRKTTLFGKREGGTTHFVKSDACFFFVGCKGKPKEPHPSKALLRPHLWDTRGL